MAGLAGNTSGKLTGDSLAGNLAGPPDEDDDAPGIPGELQFDKTRNSAWFFQYLMRL